MKKIGFLLLLLIVSKVNAQSADPDATELMAPPGVRDDSFTWLGSEPCTRKIEALSLAGVVERALCNNPQTRAAWQDARYQAAQVGVAKSAFRPTLQADAAGSLNTANRSGTFTKEAVSVSANYLLYDFGGRQAALDEAQQILAAANATQLATLQTVFLSAVQGYYQYFSAVSALDAAKETEKSSRESFNAAKARYAAGVATPADKLQAQTALSQAILDRVRGEGNVQVARGVLANSMGMDANESLQLIAPAELDVSTTFEADVNALIAEARNQRPDLAAAEAQIKAAEANVKVAESADKPKISVTSNLGLSDTSVSDTARSAGLGVEISIPIFTGYANGYRIRAASEQVGLKQAQRDQLSQQIALNVWQSYQNVMTETQAVRSSQDLLNSATQSEKVALGRYKAGVGNIIDVLTAQSALASARQQHIQAAYSWRIAKATLAQAMGRMDVSVLSSPVP